MVEVRNIEPLISIVVPVYNAENNLKGCLESILSQDYQDIEIILIDDGSRDTSPEICGKYKKECPDKITFFSQENGGPSVARNKGIELSKGKYIAFVDSDDTIAPNMISTMVEKAEVYDADMVICAYWKVTGEDRIVQGYALPEGVYSNGKQREVLLSLLNGRPGDVRPYSWVRLTRRSVFVDDKLRFSEKLYRSEDFHFWVRVHSVINKVYLLSQTPLYNYYENDSSVTHNHVNGYWDDVQFIYSDLQKSLGNDNEISKKLDIMLIKRSLIALNNSTFCKSAKEAYREINQVITDKKLNQIIKKMDSIETSYYVRYRSLMSKGLKGVIAVKYLMRWLKYNRLGTATTFIKHLAR